MKELNSKDCVQVAGGLDQETAEKAGEIIGGAVAVIACAESGPLVAYGCSKLGEAAGKAVAGAVNKAFSAPTYSGQSTAPKSDYPSDLPTLPGGEPRYTWDVSTEPSGARPSGNIMDRNLFTYSEDY